ncbi:conserved hypothetical protein [Leishmania braziliensis MHOM/BR/75/M2904]|uniref:Methyltransferase n=2 Tax=Leishmania braziliensis TaxID=5660 RepID=A4HQL9_LEIBR|nr:conserved hypothetical protein [Leishmania braziliensis MHOM/BR/75/M2904]CAJ2482408.1 unnamed protein product [Leishmania braziliensis]CAJ2482616.1 unnamed protein product [Leishmania braziliensis]CAM44488.1 conserved hypothetical protein [Leishmania braziliensis MHOM/BR/75/M2904]SYZ70567.1 hypothetical_protein [Leishmania braziliensis MHOM/BR/75/M2904]
MFQSGSSARPKLEPAAAGSYQPAQISREKYEKIVQGRNRFFLTAIGSVALFLGISSLPQFLIYRCARQLYRKYCHGKVLDLSPKLYDEKDVALYEMSKAVCVEFLIEERVVDDGHYRSSEALPEEEQEKRRRAMTLDFMIRNDHNWVGSTVNFATVLRADTQLSGFQKYDCVLLRDELLNLNETKARNLFDSAVQYVKEDGLFLVMDVGKATYPRLNKLARWFNNATNSNMCFVHDYHGWISESMLYDVKEEQRCLFGFYYALVLQPRKASPPMPPKTAAPVTEAFEGQPLSHRNSAS